MNAAAGLPLFEAAREETALERRFREFHVEHPEVYRVLVALARRAKEQGRERYGMKAVIEVARWNRMVEKADGEEFRFCNSLAAYYAREIMKREADLAGFFETRETVGEREDEIDAEDARCGPTGER
jgi:hypothetical protein